VGELIERLPLDTDKTLVIDEEVTEDLPLKDVKIALLEVGELVVELWLNNVRDVLVEGGIVDDVSNETVPCDEEEALVEDANVGEVVESAIFEDIDETLMVCMGDEGVLDALRLKLIDMPLTEEETGLDVALNEFERPVDISEDVLVEEIALVEVETLLREVRPAVESVGLILLLGIDDVGSVTDALSDVDQVLLIPEADDDIEFEAKDEIAVAETWLEDAMLLDCMIEDGKLLVLS
jgi:hypothetical protein